jgi:drug/metabolite transporter (DMT)-like permease
MGESNETPKKCGLTELLIFIAAIISGTACSVCSKTMMQLHGVGIDGNLESFSKPIFQTFGMFVGMMFGLVMHWFVLFFEIPFPGYDHEPQAATTTTPTPTKTNPSYGSVAIATGGANTGIEKEKDALLPNKSPLSNGSQRSSVASQGTPVWMYFFLAIPSVFDLAATALCMMGLRYLDVSVYQLLRGSGIIFVALMKQHVLGDHLYKFQWVGVFWNVVSVFLVGGTAVLNSSENPTAEPGEALLGVVLVMCGAFVQALQFVFEEKVMAMDEGAAPPLLLIGMEGLWGTFLCLAVVYPLAYYLPGPDHGSFEDPFNTYDMFVNSPTIQWAFFIYFFAIFAYNLFAVLVTFLLNSVWHAILDNFRPITVWGTDMFIFYVIAAEGFGEPWTKWSWVQLFGMCVLLYGTAVYNAPNAGSFKLQGEWFHFGLNMNDEYEEIELESHEAEMEREWQERKQIFKSRRPSSMAERSPHISVHTQALRGLAAAKI